MSRQSNTHKFEGPDARESAKRVLDADITDQKIDYIHITYEYETDKDHRESSSKSVSRQSRLRETPDVQGGAQRYGLTALQHFDEPATYKQIAAKAKEELGYPNDRGSVTAEMSDLAKNGYIERERSGPNGSYRCWLTDQGEDALRRRDTPD